MKWREWYIPLIIFPLYVSITAVDAHNPGTVGLLIYSATAIIISWFGFHGLMALGRWSDAREARSAAAESDDLSVNEEPKEPEKPAPEAALPAGDAPPDSFLRWARLCWILFWIVLVFPFVRYGIPMLTGSWETLSQAPGHIIERALTGIADTSPLYQVLLLALGLGFVICQVKANRQSNEAARRDLLKARLALLLVAAIGASVSVYQIAFVADEVFKRGGVVIPEDDGSFRETLLVQLASAGVSNNYDAEITAALDAEDIERARYLLQAADLTGRPISYFTRSRYEREAATWSWTNLKRNGERCLRGAVAREADTLTHLVCMVAADFIMIPALDVSAGDTLDLGIEIGGNLFSDQEIDPVIAALAASSMAIDLFFRSDEDLQQVQPALSVVKAGIRASRRWKMAPRLHRQITHLAGGVADTQQLKRINLLNFRTVAKNSFRREGLKAFRPALDDLHTIYRNTGNAATPILALRHADELSDLKHYKRISQVFGKKADGVIGVLGKGWKRAFWRAGKAGTKATVQLAAWYSALAASIAAFVISLSTGATGWLVKRMTMTWAKRAPSGVS